MIKAYLLATKPWIVCANLVAATAGFLLAARGDVVLAVFLPTLIGISLFVASGCVFNNCIDRNLDLRMARTRRRALATRSIPLAGGLAYASLLGLVGAALLWTGGGLLPLAVASAGFVVYVGVYSLWLKRTSVHSTVIGSLAGAAPPLAAYLAASHRFDLGAVLVAAVFSLWQIPHSYAITIFRFQDYSAAALPVMPVKAGIPATKRQIARYIVAFTLAAQSLTFCGYTGYASLAVATALGISWLSMARSGLTVSDDRRWAKALYVYSMVAITVLCVMLSLDAATPSPRPPSSL